MSSSCPHCSAAVPSDFRFCGMCGVPLGVGAQAAAAPEGVGASPGPGVLRRYRGPLVLGSVGTILLLAGGGIATAILSAFQLDAAPAVLVDIFQPFIEEQVGGTIADGVADVTGTADGATEASAWMLAGFVISALVGAFGALLMLIAGAWGANRAMTKRRAGTVAIPPAPVPPVYERPSFAQPAAPTVAVPSPPAPAEAPTVAIPSSEAPTRILPPHQPPPPTGRRLG